MSYEVKKRCLQCVLGQTEGKGKNGWEMTGKLDAPASISFTSQPSNAHFFRSTPGACSQAIKPQSNSSKDYSLPDV